MEVTGQLHALSCRVFRYRMWRYTCDSTQFFININRSKITSNEVTPCSWIVLYHQQFLSRSRTSQRSTEPECSLPQSCTGHLSYTRWILSTPSHPISLPSILITNLHHCLPSGFFLSRFLPKLCTYNHLCPSSPWFHHCSSFLVRSRNITRVSM
jgi:hypothetical protein